MSDMTKITSDHLRRPAVVYIRQSTPQQVECNRESTERQYNLVERAVSLGWSRAQVEVIDSDLGVSGSVTSDRQGFSNLTSRVALGKVGIVLGIEVSRLARNNAEWYRLLDLCGVTNTLIGDSDGLYHPGLFNDRLVLGLKGTMSEAELHVLRARLNGGIRNKVAKGELRMELPLGFVWGERDGEVRFHPNEAIQGIVRAVFDRFKEIGSARQVWLWVRSEGLRFPADSNQSEEARWNPPTYSRIYRILTNPVYAGAYVYGKKRFESYVDESGHLRKRTRELLRSEWTVLRDHHPGYITWEEHESILERLGENTRPRKHEAGGAVREGTALLQGLAICSRCGRKMRVYYMGRKSLPGYYCPSGPGFKGRGEYCQRMSGVLVDEIVASAFLAAIAPSGLEAALKVAEDVEANHDAALVQWRRQVEHSRYEAERAERRYRAVEPENRLVARSLEAEWEKCLHAFKSDESELQRREKERPRNLTPDERKAVLELGTDVAKVWNASTTTIRDRKELLRTLLEEVIIDVRRDIGDGKITMRWRGGEFTELSVPLRRYTPPARKTDEDTVDLLRRLAVFYSDDVIAGILNKQNRKTASGSRFTANTVRCLRHNRSIPRYTESEKRSDEDLVSIRKAAKILGVDPSTVHRCINDGFIPAEQPTQSAPWRIRLTNEIRSRFLKETPPGYVGMKDAIQILRVSKQAVLQKVKRGELKAVYIEQGRRKGLRIQVTDNQLGLFEQNVVSGGAV